MPHFVKRIVYDGLGILLILVAIPIGWVPGPGGIPLALIGLGLLAKNNQWARDLMNNFEQKLNHYVDKVMEAGPLAKATIDLIGIGLLSAGVFMAVNYASTLRFAGIGLATTGFILAILNRRRATKLIEKFKK